MCSELAEEGGRRQLGLTASILEPTGLPGGHCTEAGEGQAPLAGGMEPAGLRPVTITAFLLL